MKTILGISGSPRNGGNSEWALGVVLGECARIGAKTDQLLLSQADIKLCTGCLLCEDETLCPINDDMKFVYEKMKASEILVFATPSYFDNVTGILKNLIDRTNLIVSSLKGKEAAIIIVGQADEISWKSAARTIESYCNIAGITVIGEVLVKARDVGDLQRNEQVMDQLIKLSNKVMTHGK